MLGQAIEHSIAPGERDHSPRRLRGLPDLFAARLARRRPLDRAVLVAEPERSTVDAAMLMFHASQANTTPLIDSPNARFLASTSVTLGGVGGVGMQCGLGTTRLGADSGRPWLGSASGAACGDGRRERVPRPRYMPTPPTPVARTAKPAEHAGRWDSGPERVLPEQPENWPHRAWGASVGESLSRRGLRGGGGARRP